MRPEARQSDSQVAFFSHPPERRRRPANVAACCCCSCCCCCLHSLGGLIGSAAAGRSKTVAEQRATATYWLCLVAALVLTGLWAVLQGDPDAAFLIVALLLPAYQLGASLIAGLITLAATGTAGLPRIWSLTWRGLVGAAIGLGIMLAAFFAVRESWDATISIVLGLFLMLSFLYVIRRRPQPGLK